MTTSAALWQFPPNWLEPVTESLEWSTDVLRHEDGSEQRLALRGAPRVEYGFSVDVHGAARRLLENRLHDAGGSEWVLPIFPDGQPLTVDADAGDTTVGATTDMRDFEVDGLAVLMSEDGTSAEAFEVDSFDGSSVTFKAALAADWPAGSWLYPARLARLANPPALTRRNRDVVTGSVVFRLSAGVARTYSAESPTYQGEPVLTAQINGRDGLTVAYARQLEVLDTLTGIPRVTDRSAIAEPSLGCLWTAFGRDEVDALRKFLYARQGRARGIWVPTFAEDMIVVAPIGSSATTIDVQACGLVDNAGDTTRRDLRLRTTAGTVYHRRVTNIATVSATVERLTISSALGAAVAVADVDVCSWMAYSRLADDRVDIEWSNMAVAESTFTLTGPRHGI